MTTPLPSRPIIHRIHRYRLLLLLGGATVLALGSFWLLQLIQKPASDDVQASRNNAPDYYVEKFNFVRISKTGIARYTVNGARMIHRPQDDTFEITLPVIHSLNADRPPLTVRSARALAVPDSSKIHMIDMVDADRPASASAEHFHLKSDYMLILPDDDVLQTDRAVDLTLGSAHMTGTGMYVNNATREFRMAQRVHATYPPKAAVTAVRVVN